MNLRVETSTAADRAVTIAAIDVGSNSIRMAVAQVLPDGRIEALERLQRAVRLGQDTFRRGRLGGRSMGAAVAILRDYQRVLATYDVAHVRAVATSAVREASNADTFLDRVLMATGLEVAVIDTAEESRMVVSALNQSIARLNEVAGRNALIAEVGGGSTLLTLLEDGEISTYKSLRLGSIRLQEMFAGNSESPEVQAELLDYQVGNVINAIRHELPLDRIKTVFALGGDARFAADHVRGRYLSEDLCRITTRQLDGLCKRCARYTPEELATRHGRPFVDTETLKPALRIYQEIMRVTHAPHMIVSHVTMRDGLLLDLARTVTGKEDEAIAKGIVHSALSIAEKYRVDIDHAVYVAEMAGTLFDVLQPEHRLNLRHRLLLRVAAMLHDVGTFVSNRAHHKHSYYLISNTEIFGLTRGELQIVAHLARYHRRSMPKPGHQEYMSLPRETRMVVSRLAALLRVADALDDGRTQQVRDFRCEIRNEELVVSVRGVADLNMERRAVAAKGDLFQDIYGLRIRLEQT